MLINLAQHVVQPYLMNIKGNSVINYMELSIMQLRQKDVFRTILINYKNNRAVFNSSFLPEPFKMPFTSEA